MRFTVDKDILQSVLEYLAKRPYVEVYDLVTKLQADAKLLEEEVKVVQPDEIIDPKGN